MNCSKLFVALVTASFSFLSCESIDDFSTLKKDYQYTGAWALPIGRTVLSLESGENFDIQALIRADPAIAKIILGTIDTFRLREKLPIDIKKVARTQGAVTSIKIILLATNEFPLKAKIRLTLADRNSKEIMDLKSNVELKVDSARYAGDTLVPGYLNTIFEVNPSDISKFDSASFLLFRGYIINTLKDPAYLKIYQTYRLNAQIAFSITFDGNVKNFTK